MKCCPTLRLIQGKHYSRLVNARRQPRALSSYVRDSDPGLIYVRQTTSFLVGVRVCVNGHLRLAQKCSDDVRVSLRKTICSRGGRFPNRSRGGRFVRRSRVPNNSPSPGAPCQAPDEEIEAVALYASASEFESPDLTPEGVPPKAADFSCFLPGKNFFFTIFLPQRQHCGDLLRSNHHGLSSSSLQPRGRLP